MTPDRMIWSEETLSEALRALPVRTPPGLTTSLRVIASRERQRRAASSGFRGWRDRWELFAKNLMRPLALPLAGGVFSAVGLFSLLAPTYPMRVDNRFDVPTMLTTQVSVNRMAPIRVSDDDIIVDVTVDGQGRMIDYTILSGGSALTNVRVRRRLEGALLFTEFTPATAFGQPVASKMRFSLRSSRIDVKG
jgi:hypothetical protein